jgi:hypothetical protein
MMRVIHKFLMPALGLSIAASSSFAVAQVRIEMTTPQQTECVALTDSAGLQLVPGSTDLAATGVQLSGEGCVSGGGSAADFAAQIIVPANATVPDTVNIQWSASPDATLCTYGGSNLPGWSTGTVACQGAACGTSHTNPVTIANVGTYNFSVTCTNGTGYSADSLTATPTNDPPTPPNFLLTAPATATTGVPFQVSWNVSGATACTGSASINGSSANLGGWTDVTSPASPRTANPTIAGVYALQLTCSNVFGSVTSQIKAVTVLQGSPGCPAGQLTVGNIGYPPNIDSNVRNNVDLTRFENIWGHNTPTDAALLWPGYPGTSPVVKAMGRTQYVAAKFHVPANAPSTLSGYFKNVSNHGGLNVTTSISQTCGDFAPAQAGCLRTNISPSDNGTVYWRMTNPTSFFCQLTPGQDYYLNIKNTDPTQVNGNCAAGSPTCKMHVLNNFSN